MAAIVALPLLGLSALAGQATDETDIGPSHLTEAAHSINGYNPSYPLEGREPGGPCLKCEDRWTPGFVVWHFTLGSARPGFSSFRVKHGDHPYLLAGSCLFVHWICLSIFGAQELMREISDAVAAQDVAALAAYAKMPSVSLVAERSAMQIRDCDGATIAAHIPVTPELLAAIAVAAGQFESDR